MSAHAKFLSAFLVFSACATTTEAVAPPPKAAEPPKPEKMKITNARPFDVAACAPRAIDVALITPESLTGVLVAARPMVLECLMDPRNHQAGDVTASIKTTVTDKGATHAVTGAALTPEGKTCIDGALARLKVNPIAAGAKTVEATIEVALPKSSQLSLGDNVANDAVAAVRLAQPTMCGCYSELGINAPPVVKATVKLSAGKPADVRVESSADAVAIKLTTCVEGTLKALTYPAVTGDVQAPVDFQLINSYASAASTDASTQLKFFQLDAISVQNRADVAVAIGQRTTVSLAYDEVATKYKRKPTPGLIKELKEKCAAVLAADDTWASSLAKLMETNNSSIAAVQQLKGADAAWGDVEKSLTQSVQQNKTDLAAAETQKKNDTAACPKAK